MSLLEEYRSRGYAIGENVKLGNNARIEGDDVVIGDDVSLGEDCVIAGTTIRIGNKCSFGRGSDIRATSMTIGEDALFRENSTVLVGESFDFGRGGVVGKGSQISCMNCKVGRQVFMLWDVEIGGGGEREPWADLEIGDYVFIGASAIINVNQLVKIGDRAGIGPRVSIWTHGYHYLGFPSSYAPVVVGNKAWLTSDIVVSPGVKIGERAVVGSGAVVNKDIPDGKFAAGIPAVVKKDAQVPLEQEYVNNFVIDVLTRKYLPIIHSKGYQAEILYDETPFSLQIHIDKGGEKTNLLFKYSVTEEDLSAVQSDDVYTIVLAHSSATQVQDNMILFDIAADAITGRKSILSEDLRDFLRRQGIKFFTDDNFAPLTPTCFEQLLRR